MTPPAPTSSASSTSPPATRRAARSSTSSRRTAAVCFMPLTVGGGVRTRRGCARAAARRRGQGRGQLRRGRAARSSSPTSPSASAANACVASVDARAVGEAAGRSSPMAAAAPTGIDAVEHALRLAELGAGELLVTSMDRDGTRDGYDLALTRAIADRVSVPVVASGGVGGLDDLVAGVTRGPCQRGARRLDLPFRRGERSPMRMPRSRGGGHAGARPPRAARSQLIAAAAPRAAVRGTMPRHRALAIGRAPAPPELVRHRAVRRRGGRRVARPARVAATVRQRACRRGLTPRAAPPAPSMDRRPLDRLEATIRARRDAARRRSYVASLFAKGRAEDRAEARRGSGRDGDRRARRTTTPHRAARRPT